MSYPTEHDTTTLTECEHCAAIREADAYGGGRVDGFYLAGHLAGIANDPRTANEIRLAACVLLTSDRRDARTRESAAEMFATYVQRSSPLREALYPEPGE